jgi:phage baseplate assembly protein gpV
MSTIVSTIQEIVRQELRRVRIADLGIVEAVYPHGAANDDDNYGCDVRLKNSGLLLKRVPAMTGHIGTAAIPNVGDLVLLTYWDGDPNQPIIVGRLYNADDRAPLNHPNEVIFRLPLAKADDKTIKAAIRNIDGNSPPRELVVQMDPKITLRLDDQTVHAVAGKTEMQLKQPGSSGGSVSVIAGSTTITMDQDGDLTIDVAGDLTLRARGDISMEGRSIGIKAQMNASLEASGGQASVKAAMGATLDGGLSATVKGASIGVNGMTSFSPA